MKRTSKNPKFPAACAIISHSYLSDGRVLAASYLERHPGARFYLLVVDSPPGGLDAGPGVHVLRTNELKLSYLRELEFKYSPTEFCCALKPTLINLLFTKYKEDQVIYFDSDILVMQRMDRLFETMPLADIVLTPHLDAPIPDDGLRPNEQDILVAGAHNLGFIAVRRSKTSAQFLEWWEQRLRDGGFIEFSRGLLTDQRWIDLAPSLFSTVALKDQTYNVAYWNIHSRPVGRKRGVFVVKDKAPITFFHFSGFDPARPRVFSKHQNRTAIEAGTPLAELLDRYVDLQKKAGFAECRQRKYGFGFFDNGVAISAPIRHAYSQLDLNQREFYGNPFHGGDGSFFDWATRPDELSGGLSPFLKSLYTIRPDVAAVFPDVDGKHREDFLDWAATHGAADYKFDPVAMRIGAETCSETRTATVSAAASRGPKCAVIVPVYNNAALTRACLDSVLDKTRVAFDFETIVVDDGSTDETARLLESYGRRIRVVTHKTNLGFAASCNDGAAISNAEYLVFLNNDTEPKEGWLDALAGYAGAHAEAAVVGSKLLFPDGSTQHAGIIICEDRQPRHIYTGFPADDPRINRSRKYQAVTGACMLVRRKDFTAIDGFDTAFQNGFEDVDLCLRIGESGREVHYCHESVLVHFESASRGSASSHDAIRNTRLYQERWAARVRPDEFSFYVQDELLKTDYRPIYPLAFSISPLLATANSGERGNLAERIIQARSNQVIALLKDNIRLTVGAREAELRLQGVKNGASANGHVEPPATPAVKLESPRILAKGQSLWLSERPTNRQVSIILPVKNGAAKLQKLLPALLAQKTRDLVEIVAIDSASTDNSVHLLKQANATVIGIDPRSFNHGLTRNLATKYARGSIFVFLNQSTLPADETWLAELVKPFDSNPSLAGVCGRMLPRQDADWLNAKDSARNINATTKRVVTQITDRADYAALGPEELRLFVNFHSLSAAIRADVFGKIPFREANFAEDLMWGKDALEAGFAIQYEPLAVALHSHNYSVLDILRRNFDDGAACHRICGRMMNELDIAPAIAHETRDDWRYLEEECHLKGAELDEWKLRAVMRRSAALFGHWMGIRYASMEKDRSRPGLASILSITEQIKAGAKTEQPEEWVSHAHTAG